MGRPVAQVASLRARAAAFGLDYVIIAVWIGLITAVGAGVRAVAPAITGVLFGSPLLGELTGFLLLTLPVTLYFALSEASTAGASWGKRRLGLRVVGPARAAPGLVRSLVRSAVKFLPWELSHAAIWQTSAARGEMPVTAAFLLVLAWGLAAASLLSAVLDPRRRAVHDRVAGTEVVRET